MLSVIIPAYNEELSVERAYYTISEILEKAQIDNEIIFIDDGSTDTTYEKIKNLADKENALTIAEQPRNTLRAVMCVFKCHIAPHNKILFL